VLQPNQVLQRVEGRRIELRCSGFVTRCAHRTSITFRDFLCRGDRSDHPLEHLHLAGPSLPGPRASARPPLSVVTADASVITA